MAIQTTYLTEQAKAFEGMIANTEPNNLISRQVQTAAIGFGRAVKQGTADYQVIAATAAADIFRGITVRDQSSFGQVNGFAVAADALIMTRGVIWVKAGGNVEAGNPVYMDIVDGDFVDVSTDNLPIPRAIFESSGVNGDLVKIRLS